MMIEMDRVAFRDEGEGHEATMRVVLLAGGRLGSGCLMGTSCNRSSYEFLSMYIEEGLLSFGLERYSLRSTARCYLWHPAHIAKRRLV